MKRLLRSRILPLIAACACITVSGRAQQPFPADRTADSLLLRNDYFALEELLHDGMQLSPAMRLRCEAMTDARFRRFERSNRTIEQLLNDPELDPAWANELVNQLLSNLRLNFEYGGAAALCEQLLAMSQPQKPAATGNAAPGTLPEQQEAQEGQEANRHALVQVRDFFAALAALPASQLERPAAACEVPFQTDSAGRGLLLRVEATIGGRTEHCIFDTGAAEMCCANEAFARRHNIRNTGIPLQMAGAVGTGTAWLGIADSVAIGPLVLRNALFTVAPQLTPDDERYGIEAVIGCNFILLCGIIEVEADARKLRFPAPAPDTTQYERPNILMDTNGLCYLRATIDGRPAYMQFDTGNVKSTLTKHWFNRYRTQIEGHYPSRIAQNGGFGGIAGGPVYVQPHAVIGIGGGTGVLHNVDIATDWQLAHEKGEDGSLGTDFLLAFDRVRIDYGTMRLTTVPKSRPEECPASGNAPAGDSRNTDN